jgi:hypothetical protein
MANIILNGTTYSGTPASPGTPWKISSIQETTRKIGTVNVAADGTRTFVQRGTKREWALRWDKVPENTRAAVAALAVLASTFTFTDEHGTSYTVQTEEDSYNSATAFTSGANVEYYNLDLTLRQA